MKRCTAVAPCWNLYTNSLVFTVARIWLRIGTCGYTVKYVFMLLFGKKKLVFFVFFIVCAVV